MFPSVSCVRVLNVTCMLLCMHHVQLGVTQWTAALQASLSMGFFRQEYQRGLPCPPPGDLPNPGIKPVSLTSNPLWQMGSLPLAYMLPYNYLFSLSLASRSCLSYFLFRLSFKVGKIQVVALR